MYVLDVMRCFYVNVIHRGECFVVGRLYIECHNMFPALIIYISLFWVQQKKEIIT